MPLSWSNSNALAIVPAGPVRTLSAPPSKPNATASGSKGPESVDLAWAACTADFTGLEAFLEDSEGEETKGPLGGAEGPLGGAGANFFQTPKTKHGPKDSASQEKVLEERRAQHIEFATSWSLNILTIQHVERLLNACIVARRI